MGESMYCEHDRLAASCEDCAYLRALAGGAPQALLARTAVEVAPAEAELDPGRAPRNVSVHALREPDRLTEDTRVSRPDLDAELGTEGAYVTLKPGDAVPAELAEYPRKAAPRPSEDGEPVRVPVKAAKTPTKTRTVGASDLVDGKAASGRTGSAEVKK